MKFKTEYTKDLITLCGDFSSPIGEPIKTANGYRFEGEGYEWITEYRHHPSGVIERHDRIRCVSGEPVTVRSALAKFTFRGGEYEAYTQYSEWCNESLGSWQPLISEICTANDDLRVNASGNPFAAIWNTQSGRGMAFHVMADGKWCIRIKKSYEQTRPRRRDVFVELGLYDRDFSYRLMPGEELQLPIVLFYPIRNKLDLDAYKLHRYCNDVYPAHSMPVVYNSWMSRGDVISYDILCEQLEVAAELGMEYFVIDAGWFGAPGCWYDTVGDWVEVTDSSMCGRMKEFADTVRARGLRFGLWFELERAACGAKAVKENPQYYIYENNNYFLDFASPAACEYIYKIFAEQIEKYGIEYIKFDFNAPITYDRNGHAFLEYFRGHREVIERLRAAFPTLYFECCASGGLRMALTTLREFDSFWMSDSHSLYVQLNIFKNTLLRMPCRALEHWITIQSLDCIKGRSREKILVSGDSGWGHVEAVTDEFLKNSTVGGPIGLSCNLTAFSDTLRETVKTHIAQYKQDRDFWIHAECRILTDTPTVLVLQFSDAEMRDVRVFVYTKDCQQSGITVYPVCDGNASYTDTNGALLTGAELDRDGVEVEFNSKLLYHSYAVQLKKV